MLISGAWLITGHSLVERLIELPLRTWFYQIQGTAHIAVSSGTLALNEGCCCIVQAGAVQKHGACNAAYSYCFAKTATGGVQGLQDENQPKVRIPVSKDMWGVVLYRSGLAGSMLGVRAILSPC